MLAFLGLLRKIKWQYIAIPILVIAICGAVVWKLGSFVPRAPTVPTIPTPEGPTFYEPGINLPTKIIDWFKKLYQHLDVFLIGLFLFVAINEYKSRADLWDVVSWIGPGLVFLSIIFPELQQTGWAAAIIAILLALPVGLSISGPTGVDLSPLGDTFALIFFIGYIKKSLGAVNTVFKITTKTWYLFPQTISLAFRGIQFGHLLHLVGFFSSLFTLFLLVRKSKSVELSWYLFISVILTTISLSYSFSLTIMAILSNSPTIKLAFYCYLAFLLAFLINLLELAKLKKFWYAVAYNVAGVATYIFVNSVVKGPWASIVAITLGLAVNIILGWMGIEKRFMDVDPKKGLTIGRFTLPYETARLWIQIIFFYFVGLRGRF